MKTETIQTSFVGGEFAPSLFGRTDIAQYANACEIVENFLIRPYGSVISTPGTEFINNSKFSVGSSGIGIDNYVVLMLHGDGTNLSTTITDSSTSAKTVTAQSSSTISTAQSKFGGASISFNGTGSYLSVPDSTDWWFDSNSKTVTMTNGTTLSTVQSKFGSSSALFDGTNDYISIPDSDDFNYGSGDFTIDFWINPTVLNIGVNQAAMFYYQTVDSSNYVHTFFRSSTEIDFIVVSGGSTIVDYVYTFSAISLSTWTHVALVRSGASLYCFINGVSATPTINTAIGSTSMPDLAAIIEIGRETSGTNYFNGYLDEFRVSKGIARWKTTFTPPTSKYTTDNYTKLLCHFDGSNGAATTYDDSNHDFTIDTWVRFNATAGTQAIIAQYTGLTNLWSLRAGSGNTLQFVMTTSTEAITVSKTWNYAINTWYHIALSRSSDNFYLFADGSLLGTTGTSTPVPNISAALEIGRDTPNVNVVNGYIDEMRVSKGVARYTAAFTSSTSAYQNLSSTITRLIQFTFSRTDSYIIEMGALYFRFYTNGAVVSGPYEVAHTYTASELFDVQYAQLNDVIYLTHPNHPPATLTRIAANSWVLADFQNVGGPYYDDQKIVSNSTTILYSSGTIAPSAITGNITLSATNNIFIASTSTLLNHINTFWKVGALITDATTGLYVQGYVQITAITNPSTATATVRKTLASTVATLAWAQESWSDILGYPARVTFHQQRLIFSRTNSQPQNVWASQSFTYENFAIDGGANDDAIDIQLASTESNDIKWLVSGDSLIAGTYGGEYSIATGDGSPLTPSNTNAKKQTSWGSEAIIPKRIGGLFYYIQRFGTKIREFFFDFSNLNSYKSVDKTILSPHINGGAFIDMAYQQNPETILWLVCTNGTIATMTREVDQEVQGWSRQLTDGYYESIAVIPSANAPHDEVWVVVRRLINGNTFRYIERFKSMIVPTLQSDCFYLHAGLTYNAFTATSTATTNISLNSLSGICLVTSSASYFAATMVGKKIKSINSSGSTTGEMTITGYTSGTIVVGSITTTFLVSSNLANYWGVSVASISGLSHLEAKVVSSLADGIPKSSLTVSNATISLPSSAYIVQVGIPYTQTLKTLPQEAAAQRGTAQGKLQRINEVAVKVNNSHQGFSIGGSNSLLDNRSLSAALTNATVVLTTGTIPNIFFRDDYRYGSQVIIKNYDPLPMEILAIVTSLDTNEK